MFVFTEYFLAAEVDYRADRARRHWARHRPPVVRHSKRDIKTHTD